MALSSVYRGFGSTSNQLVLSRADRNYQTQFFKTVHTSGDIRAYYHYMYMTGAGGEGDCHYAHVNVKDVEAGSVNGTRSVLSFNDSGTIASADVGAATHSVLDMPDASTAGGTYAASQDVIYADGDSTAFTGTGVMFQRYLFDGDATGIAALEDKAYLFELDGATSATGNIYYGSTIRVRVGSSDKYIVLSDAENTAPNDILDGSHAAVYADSGTTPCLPVLYSVTVDGGAAADDDITIAEKVKVIDVWAVHTGGAGEASDTLTVKNATNAITDAMAWTGADKAVVRAGTLDDAYTTIAAGGTLRVTTTDADAQNDVGAGIVYVLCHRIV